MPFISQQNRVRALALAVLAGVVVGLSACGAQKKSCGDRALTLWPGADGNYALREVKIRTLSSLYVLDGPAAKVYYEGRLESDGFEGPAARPKFTESDGVCVPQDAGSSAAVAVYAQFERLQAFERRLGTLDQLTWPRRVGVDIHLTTPRGESRDNAHYTSDGDVVAILPYDLAGVPTAMNLGIVAHEHFHAHFQKMVNRPLNRKLGYFGNGIGPAEDTDHAPLDTKAGINRLVLRAWNEGLADLFAGIYTGDPEFMGKSMPGLLRSRSLALAVRPFWTAADLETAVRTMPDARKLSGASYAQGAQLARLLFQVARAGAATEAPEDFLARLLKALPRVPERLGDELSFRVFDFEEVVGLLLEGYEPSEEGCALLAEALSDRALRKGFPSCVAL